MSHHSVEPPVREEELQAYVDGVLDATRRCEVERHLAHRPDEIERLNAYRTQKLLMHEAFDAAALEPLSVPLEQIRADFLRRTTRRNFRRSAMRWAAAIACVSLIGTGGWFGRDYFNPSSASSMSSIAFTQLAIDAHALLANETPLPLTQKGAEGGNALVGWLSQRETKKSSAAPDLSAFNLELMGGRIFLASDRPVVQVIYASNKQETLSLYLGANRDAIRQDVFTFVQQHDLSTIYWRQHNLEFSLVGKMRRDELLKIATAVHEQLNVVAPTKNGPRDDKSILPGAPPKGDGTSRDGIIHPHTAPLTNTEPDGGIKKLPAIFMDKPPKRAF